jgi:hypothetical protein
MRRACRRWKPRSLPARRRTDLQFCHQAPRPAGSRQRVDDLGRLSRIALGRRRQRELRRVRAGRATRDEDLHGLRLTGGHGGERVLQRGGPVVASIETDKRKISAVGRAGASFCWSLFSAGGVNGTPMFFTSHAPAGSCAEARDSGAGDASMTANTRSNERGRNEDSRAIAPGSARQ